MTVIRASGRRHEFSDEALEDASLGKGCCPEAGSTASARAPLNGEGPVRDVWLPDIEAPMLHVSWAFGQLRQMLECKAALYRASTVTVDPHDTSQTCSKCGHVARGNRDKRRHRFTCQQCQYRSNDDRIGAMNL